MAIEYSIGAYEAPSILETYKYSIGAYELPNTSLKEYSREATALPTDDTVLTTRYTEQEYQDVLTENNIYVSQEATNIPSIHFFKNYNTNNDNTSITTITWTGQASYGPNLITVFLQVYNQNSSLWETVDFDGTTLANTNFTLTKLINTNISDYYDSKFRISCRVYQALDSSFNNDFNSDFH